MQETGIAKDPLTLKACGVGELTHREMLELFRSRYRLYRERDLITAGGRPGFVIPPKLMEALHMEGIDAGSGFNPTDHGIECDVHDFEPCCRHVLIQSGSRLIAYFRVLHEDGVLALPLRDLYEVEYGRFRTENPGAKVAEVSRLILDVPQSRVSSILARANEMKLGLRIALRLFQVMIQYARRNGLTDIFVQAHPSHASMYERHLFRIIGAEKLSPSVNHHPAVLLHHCVQPSSEPAVGTNP